MKRIKALFCGLIALALIGACGLAFAEDGDKYAVDGEELVLFDQEGVKLYLTGDYKESPGVEGNVYIFLNGVIENNSDQTVSIQYTGVVNGWNLDNYYTMNGATNVPSGSKSKTEIWFTSDTVEADSFAEVETMRLTFFVKNGDNKDMFEADSGTVHFHADSQDASNVAVESQEADVAQSDAEAEKPATETYSRDVTLPAREYATLDVGAKGDGAKALQQALIDQGFLDGGADGIYGKGTAAAVSAFQASVGLEATGTADAETQRKLFGDEGGETVTITLTGTWQTEHMQVEGMFVDSSYVSPTGRNTALLYLFYTVSTDSENLKVDCKDNELTINGANTYKSEHASMAGMYMGSYYYENYLEDVFVGDSLKVMETFVIPKGDLEPGRTIAYSNNLIPGSESISLRTDDILFLDSPEKIAQVIDPEGYADMAYQLADADADTEAKVRNALNDSYWTCYANDMTYRLDFYKNTYEMTTPFSTADGNYTVKNGYIRLQHNNTGGIIFLPYSFENGEVSLSASGFDWNVN